MIDKGILLPGCCYINIYYLQYYKNVIGEFVWLKEFLWMLGNYPYPFAKGKRHLKKLLSTK